MVTELSLIVLYVNLGQSHTYILTLQILTMMNEVGKIKFQLMNVIVNCVVKLV